ncbi:MAG: hypothetical protein SFV54_02685 [Bryobacteraceae bacterium]|nr:hypothetical protein [Bryobacteraceae bacterium]
MNVRTEIDKRVAKLSPQLQEQVLQFIASLQFSAWRGESGAELARSAGSLDDLSAREMSKAIDEECERVDAGQW